MEQAEDEQAEDQIEQIHLCLSHLSPLTSLLQAIKIGAKQVCSVIIGQDGLWLRWEDDSKTLQSSVQLRSELFSTYDCGTEKRVFGVSLAQLVDALSVFASAAKADLHIHYPGPDGELQLEMVDDGNGDNLSLEGSSKCVMYARIATLEQEVPGDMTDYWTPPVSYFLATPGSLLKEAVEDLEWPGSAVAVKLTRDPPAISFSAHGTGSLEVQLDASELSGFSVASAEVVQHYKFKNMKAALANIPAGKDVGGSVSTKVSIDANGMLKVTHLVPFSPQTGRGAAASSSFAATPALSAFGNTQQGGMQPSRVAVVQFVSLPVEEED